MDSNKKSQRSATLSISDSEMRELEKIAAEHNCLWGEKPNVSELMRQIASRNIKLISLESQLREKQKMSLAISKIFAALSEIQQILFGNSDQ